MPRADLSAARVARWLALPGLVVLAAVLAVSLHRAGHTQGDDFALYLRQARSIFDGDVGAVVADNRFAVLNSDSAFSPIAYPWVWPLVLSPFVHLWGFDYDRLKLVEVGLLCLWLVLLHGIVRRRIGRVPALAIVAVFATAPAYLVHTDQLLTEFPHLAAVAVVIWWYDRVRSRATLLTASRRDLIVLGALVTLTFNVRRESVVLLGVIAVMQVYDVIAERVDVVSTVRDAWRQIVTPYAAFAVAATLAQLLLPTALLPDNGNKTSFIDDRLGEYPAILSEQLGLGVHPVVGVVILVVAGIGAVVGVRRRPTLDGPLLAVALLSALAISTHLRKVDRYWFQITPWVVYFATVALLTAATFAADRLTSRRSREHMGESTTHLFTRWVGILAVAPLLVVVAIHLAVLPGQINDADDFNDAGRVQSGPSNPTVTPIYDAVAELTPPDAIIAFYRARTMTLLTDRLSFQTKNLDRIAANADYFAQRRDSTYWQPRWSPAEARAAGWEEVWSDPRWILWRLPEPGDP